MNLQRLAKYDFHDMTIARWFAEKNAHRALSPKYCRTLSYRNTFFNMYYTIYIGKCNSRLDINRGYLTTYGNKINPPVSGRFTKEST